MLNLAALAGQIVGTALAPEIWLVGIAIGFYLSKSMAIAIWSLLLAALIQLLVAWIDSERTGRSIFDWLMLIPKFIVIFLIATAARFVRDHRSKNSNETVAAAAEHERKDREQS